MYITTFCFNTQKKDLRKQTTFILLLQCNIVCSPPVNTALIQRFIVCKHVFRCISSSLHLFKSQQHFNKPSWAMASSNDCTKRNNKKQCENVGSDFVNVLQINSLLSCRIAVKPVKLTKKH